MRGVLSLYPLYVDPADAAAADASETLHPVTSEPAAGTESFNPQRLAALIRSTTDRLGLTSETTEIDADVLNSLPKWAQAVVQTGCFNDVGMKPPLRNKLKRSLRQQSDFRRQRKRRSFGSTEDSMEDESSELQDCLDELNDNPEEDSAMEDVEIEELPTFSTQAEITADSVEKYEELLEKLIDVATERLQLESFEQDDMDVFHSKEVKILRQSLKAIEKNDWMNKLKPELLISLMSAFDAQVRVGLTVDVFGAESPTKDKERLQFDERLVLSLLASLDVAICELTIMTTPQIDRRVLSEETIDNCFQLLHHVMRRVLLPCIDTSYMTTAFTPKEGNRRESTGGKTTSSYRVNLRANKRAQKAIERVSHLACDFLDKLSTLVLSVKLADRWIMRLSSSMVELFSLEHSSYATSLQQSALGILRAIFLQYKPHREPLLGDIVDVMLKLPTSKRTLRTVKLQNSSDMVQRITTVVVSIIQSCSAAGKFRKMEPEVDSLKDSVEPSSTPDTVAEEVPLQNNGMVVSTLEDTRSNAKEFVRMLLKACWKKTEDRDNRVVVDNFVEDLLVMFVRPEWIGAEELLVVLSSSLASILHANISADLKKPDSHHTFAALSSIGQICTTIKQYQRRVDQNDLDDDIDDNVVIEEHIDCLREAFTGKKTRSRSQQPSDGIELFHQIALKHIVVMYLQRHNYHQSDSKKLLILKFISESEAHLGVAGSSFVEQEKKLWESLCGVRLGGISSTFKMDTPSSELALKASLHLAVKREFCGLFDNLLAHIMALLSKGMPSLRARVMKCLRGIVDVDPMLMAETGVQLAVERCCSDEKPSVREAAVDLIGTYVLLQPFLFDKYFDVLAGRIRDKGIKVRKSVCRIFKKALVAMQEGANDTITEQELRRKSACMKCLVERIGHAAEDQGIKNFIIDTFQEVWFGADLSSSRLSNPLSEFGDGNTLPPGWSAVVTKVDENPDSTSLSEPGTKFVSEDGSVAKSIEEAWSSYRTPMVTPASLVKNSDSKLDNSLEVVTTIIEVIYGVPNLGWFSELLKRLLTERNSSSTKRRMAAQSTKNRSDQVAIAEDRSEKIIDRLVECLMALQEGTHFNGVSIGNAHQQFVTCMTALSAFCEAKPQLLTRHLNTIRVYLKEEDVKVQSLSVSMINNIIGVRRIPQTVAGTLEDDLELLVMYSPPSVVGPSIQCLATLSTTRNKGPVRLLRLLERFFLAIQGYKQRASLVDLSDKDNYVLQRALFAAGKIVGATDIDNHPELAEEAKTVEIGTITESLYKLYVHFVRKPGNDSCVAKAVQGMGFLFPIRPRLFLQAQQDGLLNFLLTANVRDTGKAKLQCLVSMKELLHFEEQRLENGLATRTMNRSKSKEEQVQGDQEADASLIGNVMQAELGHILLLSQQKVPQIRKEAVACIGALITQGLVNPLQCIPNLVALETDRVHEVRDAAFSQLLELYEKMPSEFHTPSVKGIKDSYSFQLSIYGNATALGVDENKKDFCLFGRLYRKFLKWTKSREPPFLKALVKQFTDQGCVLKLFNGMPTTANNSKAFTSVLKYLCYLAQIISTLPYIVEDELLYIIYSINRYVSLRLGPVMDDLRTAFAKAGVAPELLEDDESNLSTLCINEYQSLRQLTEQEVVVLQTNGSVAFAIGLMLRLKFALKRNYQLDNEKCATYKPSTPDSPVEAKERSPKKLLLPSVDDLCQTDDPIKLSWNLFMVAWHAAREDQRQLDVDLEEAQTPNPTPKRRRRSRKVVAPKTQVSEDGSDDDDEYFEGFA